VSNPRPPAVPVAARLFVARLSCPLDMTPPRASNPLAPGPQGARGIGSRPLTPRPIPAPPPAGSSSPSGSRSSSPPRPVGPPLVPVGLTGPGPPRCDPGGRRRFAHLRQRGWRSPWGPPPLPALLRGRGRPPCRSAPGPGRAGRPGGRRCRVHPGVGPVRGRPPGGRSGLQGLPGVPRLLQRMGPLRPDPRSMGAARAADRRSASDFLPPAASRRQEGPLERNPRVPGIDLQGPAAGLQRPAPRVEGALPVGEADVRGGGQRVGEARVEAARPGARATARSASVRARSAAATASRGSGGTPGRTPPGPSPGSWPRSPGRGSIGRARAILGQGRRRPGRRGLVGGHAFRASEVRDPHPEDLGLGGGPPGLVPFRPGRDLAVLPLQPLRMAAPEQEVLPKEVGGK